MKKIMAVMAMMLMVSAVYAAPNLYVSHEKFKKITVIDTASNEVLSEIPLKMSVVDMKLDPDDRNLYFISADTNALYRIKTKNLTPDTDFVSVGYNPTGLAIKNDSSMIYVINGKSANVTEVRTDTFEAVGDPLRLPGSPRSIVITDDDRKAYIALGDNAGIALLDIASNKLTGVIPATTDPWAMCTYNNLLFVSNEGMASISIIDMKQNKVINEIVTTDMPRGMSAYNNMLYVSVMNGIDMFELKGFTKPASVDLDYPVYDCEFGKTPSGPKVFVAGYEDGATSGKVAVINPYENEVTAEIEVTGAPKCLEIRRIKPTPAPTAAPTKVPTQVPPTAVPTKAFTKVPPTAVPTVAPTPVPTDTPVPVKKKKKKKIAPTPEPTIDWSLRADLNGRIFLDGRPAPEGVKMKALSKHTDKVYTARTDVNGRYTFKALPIGGYSISVEATYIKEKALAVTVNKGKNPELVIDVKRR